MKQGVLNILNRRMNRGEFLSYLGLMLVSVIGISSMLKNLAELDAKHTKKVSKGFGSGPYGV